jgi:hypothetical protein
MLQYTVLSSTDPNDRLGGLRWTVGRRSDADHASGLPDVEEG